MRSDERIRVLLADDHAVLRNGLVLLGFPAYWQVAAIGIVIIAAIALDRWRAGRS